LCHNINKQPFTSWVVVGLRSGSRPVPK
jgi:hypothetical protein